MSDIYHIAVKHVQKSIQAYFTNNQMQFNVDRIAWVVTVPAMAQEEQKQFMKQCFINGMGQFNGKLIQDYMVAVALEPEAGLNFQMQIQPQIFDRDQVVAVFDFGGGTFDLTVVDAKTRQTPTMLVTDFGDIMGGADVDRKFLEFVEKATSFERSKASEKEKSLIKAKLLLDFQKVKIENFAFTPE